MSRQYESKQVEEVLLNGIHGILQLCVPFKQNRGTFSSFSLLHCFSLLSVVCLCCHLALEDYIYNDADFSSSYFQ